MKGERRELRSNKVLQPSCDHSKMYVYFRNSFEFEFSFFFFTKAIKYGTEYSFVMSSEALLLYMNLFSRILAYLFYIFTTVRARYSVCLNLYEYWNVLLFGCMNLQNVVLIKWLQVMNCVQDTLAFY